MTPSSVLESSSKLVLTCLLRTCDTNGTILIGNTLVSEPAIINLSFMPTLLSCPNEILDNIVWYIERPAHLLFMGLTCRAFHSIVFPAHIEYRCISCDPLREDIWDACHQRPGSFANIRRLELLDPVGRNVLLPTEFKNNPSQRGVSLQYTPKLISALHEMRYLVRFVCMLDMHTKSPGVGGIILLLSTLSTCHFLQDIQLRYRDSPKPLEEWENNLLPFPYLPNLRRFALFLQFKGEGVPQLTQATFMQLNTFCRNIHHLYIGVYPESNRDHHLRDMEFLSACHWEELSYLQLDGAFNLATSLHEFNNFLSRHRKLKSLNIASYWGLGGDSGQLLDSSLPSLKQLGLRRDNDHQSLARLIQLAPRLTSLEWTNPSGRYREKDAWGIFLQNCTTLRALNVESLMSIPVITKTLPHLRGLYIARSIDMLFLAPSKFTSLLALPYLTYLGGVFRFFSVEANESYEILHLFSDLPSLRFVELFDNRGNIPRWFEIERNALGICTSYKVVHGLRSMFELERKSVSGWAFLLDVDWIDDREVEEPF